MNAYPPAGRAGESGAPFGSGASTGATNATGETGAGAAGAVEPPNGTVWIDGRLVSGDDVGISVFDHGVTVGDGIFESLKVVTDAGGHQRVFALTRHLARLRRSAAGLGLRVPYADDDLRAAVLAVLEANGPAAGRVRLTLTGGVGPAGSDRAAAVPTVIVTTAAGRDWPPSADVTTVPWRRNEHSPTAGLKTTSYADNVIALAFAHERGASEAILANTAGDLCEGTGSNVFVVVDGRLVTPPLSSGCLGGVTRELLLEITDALEESLPLSALADADEAFLTSSTRDVQPIRAVDGVALPHCPGPLTVAAAAAFQSLESRTLDP